MKGRRVLLLWKGRRDLIHMCACTRVSLKPRLSTREGKCSACRQRAGDSEPNEDGQAVTGACGRVGKGELRSGGHQEGLRRVWTEENAGQMLLFSPLFLPSIMILQALTW